MDDERQRQVLARYMCAVDVWCVELVAELDRLVDAQWRAELAEDLSSSEATVSGVGAQVRMTLTVHGPGDPALAIGEGMRLVELPVQLHDVQVRTWVEAHAVRASDAPSGR